VLATAAHYSSGVVLTIDPDSRLIRSVAFGRLAGLSRQG
jgi:hypothetical protein